MRGRPEGTKATGALKGTAGRSEDRDLGEQAVGAERPRAAPCDPWAPCEPCAPCAPCGSAHLADRSEVGDEPKAVTVETKGLMPWPMDRALALLTALRLMLPRVYAQNMKNEEG